MQRTPIGNALPACRRVLALGLTLLLSGCATLMTEKSQTVRVNTVPAGRSIYYQGTRVADGEYVSVRRDYRTPTFGLEPGEKPQTVDMDYSVEPWVIGDAGLAVFFIIPGVIAGGLDIATGAWRKLESTQVIDIETARAEAAEEKEAEESRDADKDSGQSRVKEASPAMKQNVEPAPVEPSKPSRSPSSPESAPRDPAPADDASKQASHMAEDYEPEEGIVSWYDPPRGHKTASGDPFDPDAMTAAHRTLPFGTRVRVTRLDTNYSVVVTINDRGPEVEGRIIDLARRPAETLGLPDVGIAPCRIEVISLPTRQDSGSRDFPNGPAKAAS